MLISAENGRSKLPVKMIGELPHVDIDMIQAGALDEGVKPLLLETSLRLDLNRTPRGTPDSHDELVLNVVAPPDDGNDLSIALNEWSIDIHDVYVERFTSGAMVPGTNP